MKTLLFFFLVASTSFAQTLEQTLKNLETGLLGKGTTTEVTTGIEFKVFICSIKFGEEKGMPFIYILNNAQVSEDIALRIPLNLKADEKNKLIPFIVSRVQSSKFRPNYINIYYQDLTVDVSSVVISTMSLLPSGDIIVLDTKCDFGKI